MKNPYTEAMTRILKEAVTHKTFFEKNPKALAYWMEWYSEIHYASRHDPDERLHDWENLKYAIIDMAEDEKVGEKYANFIYDAWGASIHENENSKHGKPHKLEYKINKTMDDWVKMCLDPKYRYHSLYPDRLKVLDYLLCVNGTGLDWNKDGFICNSTTAEEGGDGDIFLGYESVGKKKLPEGLKRLLKAWRMHKVMYHGFKNYKAALRRSEAERRKEKRAMVALHKMVLKQLKKEGKTYEEWQKEVFKGSNVIVGAPRTMYPMSEGYCRLASMPANAHPSYIAAGKEVCEAVLSNKHEPEESRKIARKFLSKWFGSTHGVVTA